MANNDWNNIASDAIREQQAKQQALAAERGAAISAGTYAADKADQAIKGYSGSFNLTGAQRHGLMATAGARMALSSGADRQNIFDQTASSIKGLGIGMSGSQRKQMGQLAGMMGSGLGMGSQMKIAAAGAPPIGRKMGAGTGSAGSSLLDSAMPGVYGTDALTYQTGGIIPGHGTGDKVPIKAEPGEIVIPKDVVDFKGQEFFFRLIDSTKAKLGKDSNPHGKPEEGYAEGGIVGSPFEKVSRALDGGGQAPAQQPKPEQQQQQPKESWWSHVVKGIRPQPAAPTWQPNPQPGTIGIRRMLGYAEGGLVPSPMWASHEIDPALEEQRRTPVLPPPVSSPYANFSDMPSPGAQTQLDLNQPVPGTLQPAPMPQPSRTNWYTAPAPAAAPTTRGTAQAAEKKPAPAPKKQQEKGLAAAPKAKATQPVRKTASSAAKKKGKPIDLPPISPEYLAQELGVEPSAAPGGIGAMVQGGPHGTQGYRQDAFGNLMAPTPMAPGEEDAWLKSHPQGTPGDFGGAVPVGWTSPGGGQTIQVVQPGKGGKMPAFTTGDASGLGIPSGLSPDDFRKHAAVLSSISSISDPLQRDKALIEWEKLPLAQQQILATIALKNATAQMAYSHAGLYERGTGQGRGGSAGSHRDWAESEKNANLRKSADILAKGIDSGMYRGQELAQKKAELQNMMVKLSGGEPAQAPAQPQGKKAADGHYYIPNTDPKTKKKYPYIRTD